jgi:hypothetical protein
MMADLATWSQLLSSIAVLGTLIYLGIEIRQNTAAGRAATRQAVQNAAMEEMHKFVDHPDIYLCLDKAEPLKPEEAAGLHAWLIAFTRHMEYAWLQHKSGIAEGYLWEAERRVLRNVLGARRSRQWWQDIGRHTRAPEFTAEVDDVLRDAPRIDLHQKVLAWGAAPLED